MKDAPSKTTKINKNASLSLSWRDVRYHRFYTIVDQLVDELQEHVWLKSGKSMRRLKEDGLVKPPLIVPILGS